MDSWVNIENLNLSRGGRPVLHNVSASLSGRAVGLVGANGAGKSTLIGAMLGVLRGSGRIQVMGLDIPDQARLLRTRGGVMAEHAGIFPGGSGVDAVMFAGMLSGLAKRESLRRAHRALDALDVGEERYRPANGYSTGMRQRCKLAMSLVHNPEFLILDEPTVGLDPLGRTKLLELIRDLRDEGRRILISTHILPDAEYLCDEMLLLANGAVAFSGPVDELVGVGSSRMIANGAGLDEGFVAALKSAGVEVADHQGEEVHFLASLPAEYMAFWKVVAEHDVEIRSMKKDVGSLEDAVLNAMEAGYVPR